MHYYKYTVTPYVHMSVVVLKIVLDIHHVLCSSRLKSLTFHSLYCNLLFMTYMPSTLSRLLLQNIRYIRHIYHNRHIVTSTMYCTFNTLLQLICII